MVLFSTYLCSPQKQLSVPTKRGWINNLRASDDFMRIDITLANTLAIGYQAH